MKTEQIEIPKEVYEGGIEFVWGSIHQMLYILDKHIHKWEKKNTDKSCCVGCLENHLKDSEECLGNLFNILEDLNSNLAQHFLQYGTVEEVNENA